MAKERTLEATSTWAVAVVCFVLVAISILIEQLIHHTGSWLKKKRKPSMYEALEKIKAELMLLGFISLLLTVLQESIADICVPRSVAHSWHPCSNYKDSEVYDDPCLAKGKVQFVSPYGIHQLHIFIFVLALAHVLYCVVTYGLGLLRMRKWKSWEDETKTIQYQFYNDPERFRFARDTSFGRRHLHFWSRSPVLLWIVCFFRQFFTSIAKVDYLTLRHGFIMEHLTPQSQESFNFQKYINRSLEEDFKVIVGISPVIWLCAVTFLLTNTNGWQSHFWLPFIPLIIILLVGAKLQVIITKMGIRILEGGDVIKGTPVVQPGDDLFWFNSPRLLLFLIHFVLFGNAFQLAFFAWSYYEFGYPSCYHQTLEDVIIRIAMGVVIQFLCSYMTLPLYALVTQMGSKMKPVIFSEQVASALRGWHHAAKKNVKEGRQSANTTPFSSRPTSPLHGSTSPLYLLQGYQPSSSSPKRLLNSTNELTTTTGGGGGETSPSASPRHHQDVDDFNVNGNTYSGEIVMDVEDSPQHAVNISLSDFSFRQKGSGGANSN
ncbi:PREDICTED: MLO-like protein 6 [Erythranthe guttata]|uniref:MLO-like protein 6 n=1 Tax=Erythranthe guttata TaxID=4155 RepID=UPI00064DB80C|nr:PREDICTED: MLO-like protein 6 [Erythranthe guttata]|eukprot:XP_012834490.1 PREDICTED: MLO-like protein 6 [Erythranthe guttata]